MASVWIKRHVLGLVAIFIALSGTAIANVGKKEVGTKELDKGAVTSPKIAKGAVKAGKLAGQAVTGAKVADNSITGAKINELSLDFAIVQRRLRGDCPAGQAIRSVGEQGDLTCVTVQTTGPPTGPAGGDLAGTYPNPQLAFAPWRLDGNAGTNPATDFLGTTDDQPLNLRVGGAGALRLEPTSDGTNVSPNVIGGIADNNVTAGVHSATIAGGGRRIAANPASGNRVTDIRGAVGGGAGNQAGDGAGTTSDAPSATVGGGESNTAAGRGATVGGGISNTADEADVEGSTVGGGSFNTATGNGATVGGGANNIAIAGLMPTVGGGDGNTASGAWATVGGGDSNTASGTWSTVGGGDFGDATGEASTVAGGAFNDADGDFSLAAGLQAAADHDGAFVWSDSSNFQFASTAEDEFSVRSVGGARVVTAIDGTGTPTAGVKLDPGDTAWEVLSDRATKENLRAISPREVLLGLRSVPISKWNYRAQDDSIRHIGPMAQDFHRAFGLSGSDRTHISPIDTDGVALAAIKALDARVRSLKRKVADQEARLAALERDGR